MKVIEATKLVRNYKKSSFKNSQDDIKVLKGLNYKLNDETKSIEGVIQYDEAFGID